MQRLEYVDIAKGIMILLVVAGHVVQYSIMESKNSPLFLFIYSFHMPLFFLLSGYVVGITERRLQAQSFGGWFWKKVQTLMVPFLIWTLFIYRFRDSWDEIIHAFVRPDDGGAWFLISLFLIQIICYPIVKYKKVGLVAIPVIYLVVCHFIGFSSFFYANYTHYLCYLTGYVMYHYHEHLSCPFVATCALAVFIFAEAVHPHPIVCTLSAGVALLYACKKWFEMWGGSWMLQRLSIIGRNTMAVYLIHFFFVTPLSAVAVSIDSSLSVPAFTIIMLMSLMIALICVYSAKAVSAFPFLCKLMFGR